MRLSDPYVATFYSFKGGVGRTTLLANVAQTLAGLGERVVIWDLDLEAPGIHHFPGFGPPEEVWQGGFLEWLGDIALPDGPQPPSEWPSPAALRALVKRVYAAPGSPGVHVLPAHGTNANLGRAHARIDWHALFVERPMLGLRVFQQVRDALITQLEPSFLLIDSRTGITDLGGVLTGFLPDCTVLVGNYGAQSAHGLRTVYEGLGRFADDRRLEDLHRTHKLERMLVASPVPTAQARLEQGRKRWLAGFPGVAPRSVVEVPLVESLLYAEDVLMRSAPSSDAARAYREVAQQLVRLRDGRRGKEAAPEPTRGDSMVAEVARLLTLLGLEVREDGDADLLAVDRRGLRPTNFAIVCWAPHNADPARLVERFRRLASTAGRDHDELMVITSGGTPTLRSLLPHVRFQTIAELESQLVDLEAYATHVRRTFEDSSLARGYVGQRFSGGAGDAVASTVGWLQDAASPRLMMVIGDDGSGKTSFLRRLAYELVTGSADEDPLPVPLLIDLRPISNAGSLETVLQHHLRTTIGWFGNPEAITYLLRAGRIVLLLDGLDEMVATSYSIGAEEQLRAFAAATTEPGRTPAANRVIVACARQFARDEVPAVALAERVGAVVRELAPFDDEQIAKFVANRAGGARRGTVEKLQKLAQTAASQTAAPGAPMAGMPMMLSLLVGSAPDQDVPGGGDGEELTVAALFERDVATWFGRTARGPAMTRAQREEVVDRLAAALWKLPDNELHHAVFAAELELDPAVLDRELRTAPFLQRSESGTFRFIHRTYLEYFMARHIARQASAGARALAAAIATEPLSDGCLALVRQLAGAGNRPAIESLLGRLPDPVAPDVAANAQRILAALHGNAGKPRH